MKVKNEVFMNPPRAVFFDIDRTLYDHRRDFVSPASLAAIAALRTRGIVPAIATGRGYAALPPRIAQLVAAGEMDLVISCNGQYNRYGARVLSEHPLPVADIASLIAAFRARDWEYTFVSEHHMAAGRSRGSSHRVLQGYPCYTVAPDYYREHAVHQLVVLAPEAEEAAFSPSTAGVTARCAVMPARWMCFMPTAARRAALGTPAPRSVLPRRRRWRLATA